MKPRNDDSSGRKALELAATHFDSIDGRFMCGQPIDRLVDMHGTPCFLYSVEVLEKTLRQLRAALPTEVDLYYSMKANPHPAFVRYFVDRECGIEVASGGELATALQQQCPAERLLFAGPGKQDHELLAAIDAGIGEIHVESFGEIERLARLAREAAATVRVAIRVNPQAVAQGGAMRMGGLALPFGIDEERLPDAVRDVESRPELDFVGIHMFAGTQILDAEVLLRQYRHAIAIAGRAASICGGAIRSIDLGGGLGVPYFGHENELDLVRVRDGLDALVDEIAREPALREARLVIEPGRYLVATSGVYVVTIVDVKQSRGRTFAVVDGGMHHHLAASGNLGQTIKRNFPLANLDRMSDPHDEVVEVCGPLCTPLDVLGRSVMMPAPRVGDRIGVFLSGAYGKTASPGGFLSHPQPRELWIDGSIVHAMSEASPATNAVGRSIDGPVRTPSETR